MVLSRDSVSPLERNYDHHFSILDNIHSKFLVNAKLFPRSFTTKNLVEHFHLIYRHDNLFAMIFDFVTKLWIIHDMNFVIVSELNHFIILLELICN